MNTSDSEPSRPQAPGLQVELGGNAARRVRPIWLVVLLVLLAVGSVILVAWLPNSSPTPSLAPTVAAQPSPQPRITWSEKQVEVILSPGESTVRDLTFTTSLNVQNIVIEPVPELAPFVSIQPNNFVNVPAGQQQSVRLTFSIPAGATLGTYDGTVHVRLANQTLPQTVKIAVNAWLALTDSALDVYMKYPPFWAVHSLPRVVYFTALPEVDVLTISIVDRMGTPLEIAQAAINSNKCMATGSDGQPVDRLISTDATSALYVLSCSATTDDYHFVFIDANGRLVDISYHDDFDPQEPVDVQLSRLRQILSTLR